MGKTLGIFAVMLLLVLMPCDETEGHPNNLVNLYRTSTRKKRDVFGVGGISNVESFNEAILNAHNEYREMHHSPHFHLDAQLNDQAQKYAKELSIRGISQLRHSEGYTNGEYGENLFAQCGRHVLPIIPVKSWYSKVCQYDFLAHGPKNSGIPVKEFTQIVWRGTEKLGVGRVVSLHDEKPCTYIVTQYLPRHSPGARRNNVDVGDFNKEICKDLTYHGFGARG